jgi:O-antigen ligase
VGFPHNEVVRYDALMSREQHQTSHPARLPILIAAAGFFFGEIAVLAGAASPFRLPKEAAALAALCGAIALAVAVAARRRRIALPRGRLAVALSALPVLQCASALWSTNPALSVESALLTAIWILGILWLATIGDDGRRRVFYACAVGAALSVSVMLLQLVGLKVFNFAAPFASARLSLTGMTGNPADLAMACVLLVPFLMIWGESSKRPWFSRSLIVLFALATLITQTLTGIAALGAVILVWLVHQRSRRLWGRVAVITTIVVAVALAAGLGDRLQQQVQRVRTGDWYRLLSARWDGWTAAGEMIRDHRVLGVGAAAFTHQYYPSRNAWLVRNGGTGARAELASHFQWAHCDPLQMVAELGLPGIGWMVFFGWALVSAGRRTGPLLPLTVAATAPFAILHYPTHLAVGLIPISLALSDVVANAHPAATVTWQRARAPVVIAVTVVALLGVFWQLRRVAVDVWVGGLELRMAIVQSQDAESRARMGAAVESQIVPRLGRLGVRAPAVWRTLGRARLLRGDAAGAEAAFTTSFAAWPHEDAEFYLGLSLNAQGRRNEAVAHLSRVCRTNPKLADLIADERLRRTVTDVVDTYSAR